MKMDLLMKCAARSGVLCLSVRPSIRLVNSRNKVSKVSSMLFLLCGSHVSVRNVCFVPRNLTVGNLGKKSFVSYYYFSLLPV